MSTPEDTIQPTKIEHLIDEGYASDGEQLFHYNYLRYEFEHPAGAISARNYLDASRSVAIYLPSGVSWDDEIVQKVIAYLRRRYTDLTRLTDKGYEPI